MWSRSLARWRACLVWRRRSGAFGSLTCRITPSGSRKFRVLFASPVTVHRFSWKSRWQYPRHTRNPLLISVGPRCFAHSSLWCVSLVYCSAIRYAPSNLRTSSLTSFAEAAPDAAASRHEPAQSTHTHPTYEFDHAVSPEPHRERQRARNREVS